MTIAPITRKKNYSSEYYACGLHNHPPHWFNTSLHGVWLRNSRNYLYLFETTVFAPYMSSCKADETSGGPRTLKYAEKKPHQH